MSEDSYLADGELLNGATDELLDGADDILDGATDDLLDEAPESDLSDSEVLNGATMNGEALNGATMNGEALNGATNRAYGMCSNKNYGSCGMNRTYHTDRMHHSNRAYDLTKPKYSQPFDVAKFFQALTVNLQMYHWSTSSYSRHTASGNLVTKLQAHTDLFNEVLQGIQSKIEIPEEVGERSHIIINSLKDDSVIEYLNGAKLALAAIVNGFEGGADTLKNLRDEIIADIDQTIYLFSFQ